MMTKVQLIDYRRAARHCHGNNDGISIRLQWAVHMMQLSPELLHRAPCTQVPHFNYALRIQPSQLTSIHSSDEG